MAVAPDAALFVNTGSCTARGDPGPPFPAEEDRAPCPKFEVFAKLFSEPPSSPLCLHHAAGCFKVAGKRTLARGPGQGLLLMLVCWSPGATGLSFGAVTRLLPCQS
jgi:hypothetical protein